MFISILQNYYKVNEYFLSTVCCLFLSFLHFFSLLSHIYNSMLDFSLIKNIHFIGIGGVSLSSLARFFHRKGYCVSGTDSTFSPILETLIDEGIKIRVGFSPDAFPRPDLVVYSSAVPETDTELIYMRSIGVPCVERYVLLGYVSSLFPFTIAISGTHGKTTVSSMCGCVMKTAMLPFYAHIGGESNTLGGCYYSGDTYFLCEACEYRKSMLALSPFVSVVLNVEFDHPDTYKDKTEVYDTFDTFLQLNPHGISIINGDCEYYKLRQKHFHPITFGFNIENDYVMLNIEQHKNGCFGCSIYHLGVPLVDILLKVPGKHNLINACACVAVCNTIGVPTKYIKQGLNEFTGVKRRFEFCGTFFSSAVYSDYAHHPTEIRETLNTAKLLPHNKLTVVFQPHTFSRTSSLKAEFIKVLSDCDNLIIVKEYAARENADCGCSALSLFNECTVPNKFYCSNILEVATVITKQTAPNDVILVLGAGDINNLCKILISTT